MKRARNARARTVSPIDRTFAFRITDDLLTAVDKYQRKLAANGVVVKRAEVVRILIRLGLKMSDGGAR